MPTKLTEWAFKFAGDVLSDDDARQAFECLVSDFDALSKVCAKKLTTGKVLALSAAISSALMELGVKRG